MSVEKGKDTAKPSAIPLEETVGSQQKATRHPPTFYESLIANNCVAIDTGKGNIIQDFHVIFPQAYLRYQAYSCSERAIGRNFLD